MITTTLALAFLLPLATSHFTLDSPLARGFNEDQLAQFPCGGVRSTPSPIPIPYILNHPPPRPPHLTIPSPTS